MSASHLPRHIRNGLGVEAGRELMTILDAIRDDSDRHARGLKELQNELHSLQGEVQELRRAMERGFLELDVRVANVKSDLMKWSFVFWCGAVTAVAALAGVLRS